MSIPSNKDFTDLSTAKSFINKNIDTGLEKEKNQEIGTLILKVCSNLWHKVEITFRQLGNYFEEGWITNETIKDRLIKKISEFKDDIDELSRKKKQLGPGEGDELLTEMKNAQATMISKIKDMKKVCTLFIKRGDKINADVVEKELNTLNKKVGEMLEPLDEMLKSLETIAALKGEIKGLQTQDIALQKALKESKAAAKKVEKLEKENSELVKLKTDISKAELQILNLKHELAAQATEKKPDTQKEEMKIKLQKLEEALSKSTEQMKIYLENNKALKAVNEELTLAREDAEKTKTSYEEMFQTVDSERGVFLRDMTSSMKNLESDLTAGKKKLREKDREIAAQNKKIDEQDKKIADLETQLAETKKRLQQAKSAEFDEKRLVSPAQSQAAHIQAGIVKEKGPIIERRAIEASPAEEFPWVEEPSPVEEFTRVTDVTRLNKLRKAMSNFMEVAKEKNLVLDGSRLDPIYKNFKQFDADSLVHAANFFKEIETQLVRFGMAEWNRDKTGVKINENDHPELKDAYKKALKAFYKIEGAKHVKDELPVSNERKKRDAEHMRSQKEKMHLLETPFVANLEESITALGNAMQKLVRATEKSGLSIENFSGIETMVKGPWNSDVDTVEHATQIFNRIEDSLVKQGIAEPGEKRVGVTIDKDKHPMLEKAYEKALAAYDAHIDALHDFYAYDDLIHQNNERLSRLIVEAKHERRNEPLERIDEGEELPEYDRILNKFNAESTGMSDDDILRFQREVLGAIREKYKTDEFPSDSEIARLNKEAEDGVVHLEFTRGRHEGFKRGVEVKSEELEERRIEELSLKRKQRIKERSQKFDEEFPVKKIKKSVAERLEKPAKRALPKEEYADYESRSEDIQFKDPRTTSRDQRKFEKKEAKRAAQSKMSGEQKQVLNAARELSPRIEQLDVDLKDLVRLGKNKGAIGNTGWEYSEKKFELLERPKSTLSRENVVNVANDYVYLLKQEFVASNIASWKGNDIVFNEDADIVIVSKYNTVLKDIESVKEARKALKSTKEVKRLAGDLKDKIQDALNYLIQVAEAKGMAQANPLFKGGASDPLQSLEKFKRKGLRLKGDSLANAANDVLANIRAGLEGAGIYETDPEIVDAIKGVEDLLKQIEK